MSTKEFKKKINLYADLSIPFIFIIDFEMKNPLVFTINEAAENGVYFDIKKYSNFDYFESTIKINSLQSKPISKAKYFKAFNYVVDQISKGNSYLLNLTFPTKIKTNNTLRQLFNVAKAPYKLLVNDEFLIFSPECFIKIIDNKIYSYPMKGTIDASIPNAEKIILNDQKELYEHNTIVDLIRNDISIVSTNVKVNKFRYIDKIRTTNKELLQVSSEIIGELPKNWKSNIGNIILKLLPAGSISGAPKKKTIEIIQEAEKQNRGYYTGVFGIFDGNNLDSAVNIRFISNEKNKLQYHSGGGITALSDKESEYNELINKIYVPTS